MKAMREKQNEKSYGRKERIISKKRRIPKYWKRSPSSLMVEAG